ncbi:MAG: PEP-CTERM sorting domain-containing protein [Planctomycetota bacterium]
MRLVKGLSFACAVLASGAAHGQSDPAGFNAVIDVTSGMSVGGSVGSDTQVNLFDGGLIEPGFEAGAFGGSTTNIEVNVFAGVVGDGFRASQGATVNVLGGVVRPDFLVRGGGAVNIRGGVIAGDVAAILNGHIEIAGGEFNGPVNGFVGSATNITGRSFAFDGQDVTSLLTLNEPFDILFRGGVLSGEFVDGAPFSFDVNGIFVDGQDFWDNAATLTITRAPEPTTAALLLAMSAGVGMRRRR